MGQVTVGFDDYQGGHLPDVCVFTGQSTPDRMVLRTRIVEREAAEKPRGTLFGYVSRRPLIEDPRKPRDVLVGKLPVAADHLIARQRRATSLRIGSWASLVVLVIAAVTAQPWSPYAATVSIAAIGAFAVGRAISSRDLPTPTLIGAGTRVHLSNVHDRFVEAVNAGP